ncbi:Centrosome-associated protein 350 (Cep350) (Centrosome-associated protein of 350 kDa) [Durusdinium trenchii]|uniref:Centrosome-associated protein 350 (Cep350) (Centrosome-associated protein of 350 kDa) n=1 Tax=Durusdinium trenchii TaxID=1381693 RepID=A0ABP0IN12_9DINO
MEKLELLQEQLQLFEPEALELELERGRAEAHQLRRQLAEAKTTVTEAQTKATEVQMNEAQLAKDSQSQHASADLDAKLAALEKQHDDFQRSAAERAQKLEMQRQELQKDLELEREQRDRARAEAHELRTQLAEARAELETGTPGTRGQLAMLQKEREEMEREAFAKDQEIQRQSAKLEELSQALKRESEKLALKEQQIKDSEMRLLQELEQERGRGRAAHKLPLAEDATAPDTPKASKASKARAEKVQEQLQPEAERCGKRLPQHPGEVATVAQVHGLMAQVERLNATVEHLAAKREPQLVDPEAGPSTRRCQARAARAARSPFCFDESSILPDATDAPSPSGRLSDPFVPNVPSDPRAASETLLPDLEATDATIEPPRVHAEPGRRRLSDPFVPNAPSDPRAASETLPPDLEATDATIEPPRVHAEPGRRRLSGPHIGRTDEDDWGPGMRLGGSASLGQSFITATDATDSLVLRPTDVDGLRRVTTAATRKAEATGAEHQSRKNREKDVQKECWNAFWDGQMSPFFTCGGDIGTFYIRIIPYPYFGTILTYFVPQEILGHMKDLCVQHQMLKSEVARLDQVERLAADADVKHQRQAEAPVVLSAPKRSEEADHWVGERVQVKMKTGMCCGTVRFNGTTHSGGHRIGVELDEPVGKNDGSVKEHRYFTCAAKHGVFLHPKDIFSESDPGSSVLEVRHIIKELLTKADGVSDKQAATIAKVHELMSQVEHLDDTVEHVAIRRKQLAEVEQSGDMYNGEVDSKVATLARRVKDPNATLEFSALPKREPQLVDPEAGPSTTGCPAARAARSRFCFDESSRPFGPDATDDGDVSPYARSPSRPSPYGRLSDPFVPDLSSNSRAASETLLPDSTAPDGLLDPLEPVRGRLSDPVVLDLSSDSRASDTRYLPDDEFGVRLILPP